VSSDEDTRISREDEETAIAGRSSHAVTPAPIQPLEIDVDLERTRIAGHATDEAAEHTILRGRRVGTPAPIVDAAAHRGYRAPSVEPGASVTYGVNDRRAPVEVTRVVLNAPTERSRLVATPEELRAAAKAKAKRRATVLVILLVASVAAVAGAILLVITLVSGADSPPLP
jgi:hypothetical protein